MHKADTSCMIYMYNFIICNVMIRGEKDRALPKSLNGEPVRNTHSLTCARDIKFNNYLRKNSVLISNVSNTLVKYTEMIFSFFHKNTIHCQVRSVNKLKSGTKLSRNRLGLTDIRYKGMGTMYNFLI